MILTVDELVNQCFDTLQISQRFVPYAEQAEAAGLPGLARLFRAMVASETAREALMRKGMVNHGSSLEEYFVCPSCGLIFHAGRPDQCPVDETQGSEFICVE